MSLSWPAIARQFLLIALLGGSLGHAQVRVQPVPVPPLTGHVLDLTHTLTEDQQREIERSLAAFEARKGSQLADRKSVV